MFMLFVGCDPTIIPMSWHWTGRKSHVLHAVGSSVAKTSILRSLGATIDRGALEFPPSSQKKSPQKK